MFTTRPELRGDFGMVASTHWLASAVGMGVLERGGNAADAAVAAGFVLQVVEPHLNGPGGEVPILLWDPADEQVRVIAGQGVTPAAATPERFAELGLDLVPGTGPLAATVPGAVGAWLLLLRQWGTWRLRDVLEPAIGYAERGWPLLPSIARTIATVEQTFRNDWPTSAATWLPLPPVGGRMRSPVLAGTWRRLVAEAEAATSDRDGQIEAARTAFYEGFVAEAIDAHVRQPVRDSSGSVHAGLLTADDLAAWQCPVEAPTRLDYGNYTVCKTGAWGQGPVFLQQLALLSRFDLAGAGHLSPDYVHVVVEASKLAFADREAWYGDGADVPMLALLSDVYTDERASLIGSTASLELRPGSPEGRTPLLRAPVAAAGGDAAGTGEPTVSRDGTTRGDTCHVDVVDQHGLMISATPSGGWLQSSPTVEALGWCLGTRAQMTWLEPGLAATLRPGTRPRTTLSPSLALREGRPYLAFGTPGGDQQDQWSLLFFLAHVHFGLDLQAAIDAPAFHSTHFPSSFWPRTAEPGGVVVEDRIGAAVIHELRRRGHHVSVSDGWSLGRVSAAGIEPGTGFLRAAANPRGAQGYAVGR
ncbi:MAG: gamma-glutamyltranspeptidase / glutathione hydrolase [Frankiales bacterium]|nr:gamma-glutamyltranspeptidase / glutathione hydrolase [Frankiales bacterium]